MRLSFGVVFYLVATLMFFAWSITGRAASTDEPIETPSISATVSNSGYCRMQIQSIGDALEPGKYIGATQSNIPCEVNVIYSQDINNPMLTIEMRVGEEITTPYDFQYSRDTPKELFSAFLSSGRVSLVALKQSEENPNYFFSNQVSIALKPNGQVNSFWMYNEDKSLSAKAHAQCFIQTHVDLNLSEMDSTPDSEMQ